MNRDRAAKRPPNSGLAFAITPAPEPHRGYDLICRSMDIVLGSLLLFLALPVIASAMAILFLEARQTPLYRQERIGYLGRPFTMLKLRTMRKGLEEKVPAELNETGGPTFKARRDPRVTGVGKWVRKLSIDELPQLLNVVAGQMALVGPRPPLRRETVHYRRGVARRLSVKPGLTCVWQVSGRSQVSFRRWMAMDRLYIRRRSLGRDLGLLLRTPIAVLSGRGAY